MSEAKATIVGTMSHTEAAAAGFTARGRVFELELCRMLINAGYSGRLVLNDVETGKPRCTFRDIAAAALMDVSETKEHGPKFVKFHKPDFGFAKRQAA